MVQSPVAITNPSSFRLLKEMNKDMRNQDDSGKANRRSQTSSLIEGRDYYMDKQGRLVMTARYLLDRGYCCENGCRHCPYDLP